MRFVEAGSSLATSSRPTPRSRSTRRPTTGRCRLGLGSTLASLPSIPAAEARPAANWRYNDRSTTSTRRPAILQSQHALLQRRSTGDVRRAERRVPLRCRRLPGSGRDEPAGRTQSARPLLNCFTQAVWAPARPSPAWTRSGPPWWPDSDGRARADRRQRSASDSLWVPKPGSCPRPTFTSSQDALAALTNIRRPSTRPRNSRPTTTTRPYQALIALDAKVVADLTTRAAALPRLVTYSLRPQLTSHALANLLYGDAGRSDELRAENKVRHPAFMPPTGTALSEA